MRWVVVDAPLDSSGTARGEEQAPAALRRAGLIAALAADDGGEVAWLHLDLDAVDPRDLPAVTYPEPDGLRWPDLVALVTPLARADRLLGMSVTDLNADEDPDGRHAGRVVEILAAVLGR